MESELKLQTLRGLRTGWLEAGNANKPILFLLHGYPDTPEVWKNQISHFADKFHIIAPYARGTLPSSQSNDLARFSASASLLDHLSILRLVDPHQQKKIIIVGHDIGALHAWDLAEHMPDDQLLGLVIINGLHPYQIVKRLRNIKQLAKSWYVFLIMVPFLADKVVQRYPAKMLQLAHKIGGLSLAQRPKLAESLSNVLHPLKHYRAFFRHDLHHHLRTKPKRLQKPVLVLWGEKDPFLQIPDTKEFASVARTFTIRILPGKHWLQKEQSAQVNSCMEKFMAEIEQHAN